MILLILKVSTSHLSIWTQQHEKIAIQNRSWLSDASINSSCFEFDLGLGGLGGSYGLPYDSIFSVPTEPTYRPAFVIDSVLQNGKSAVTIWAHILYDTVLVINARTAYSGYLDHPEGEGYSIIESQADTINFRLLADTTSQRNGRKGWICNYTVDVDSLTSGTTYWFCTIGRLYMH